MNPPSQEATEGGRNLTLIPRTFSHEGRKERQVGFFEELFCHSEPAKNLYLRLAEIPRCTRNDIKACPAVIYPHNFIILTLVTFASFV
jgi:hypothetical protein